MESDSTRDFGRQIQKLIIGEHLSRAESYAAFKEVLTNQQPDLQQGAFLAALVAKGETVDEIAGAWQAIDELDTVHTGPDLTGPLCDNSGTGMDQLKTFNVSSASAIIAAAGGVRMGRHGARALTSKCGTVDILERVGIGVEVDVATVAKSIATVGIGLFNGMSPQVHPGALGRILSQIRFGSTLNIAASLANPCRPSLGLRGVYAEQLVAPVGEVMREIGYRRAMVVYGKNCKPGMGMDEISVLGETVVHEFQDGEINNYVINPEALGLASATYDAIAASGDLEYEATRFIKVLAGCDHSACIDFTCANAGAILYVAGKSESIKDGVNVSREIIASGQALAKLKQWVEIQVDNSNMGLAKFEGLLEQTGVAN